MLIFTLGLVKQSATHAAAAASIAADEQIDASVVESADDGLLSSFGDDLDKAESKASDSNNKPKLEIIKQIRKLNSDGSYTVGYEAEDGTFKIESRDVLGNVKGTYGYVDVNGEIKRVSYTTNNGSSSNSIGPTTIRPTEPKEDVVQIPRQNKTGGFHSSTTRRPPSLAFLTTSQSTPTSRASVVQSIPKKRILLTASSERPTFNHYGSRHADHTTTSSPLRKGGEPTTTVVYATSLPTGRPTSAGHNVRPTPLPGTYKTVEQIARPEKLEITDHVSKVKISSNRDTSTSKPVTEEVDEKEVPPTERPRGNFVRRQLAQDDHDEKFAAQQQVIYSQSAGDDSGYGIGSSSGPPSRATLFANNSPRIPSVVLAARSRAALLQNVINGNAQKAAAPQPDKVYVKPPRRRVESSSEESADSEPSTEPSSENQYVAQRPGAVVQIVPANEQAATEEDKRVYRRPVTYPPPPPAYGPNQSPVRHREFVRQAPPPDFDYGGPRQFRIPIPQAYPQQFARGVPYSDQSTTEEQDQQYLRETTSAAPKAYAVAGNEPGSEYTLQRPRGGRGYLPLPAQHQQQRGGPPPPPPPSASDTGYEQESLPVPFAQNPYSPYNRPPLPSQYYQNPDRPLTARDFERLLNLLVFRHQQLQQYQGGFGGFGGGGGGYGGYAGGPPQFGYQQIPRPPLFNPYDPRYAGYNRVPYGEYSEQEALYQQGGRAGPSSAGSMSDPQYPVQRNIARRQPIYQPQYMRGGEPSGYYPEASQPIGQQQDPRQQAEYLPSDIREELLYRMLLLAMQPGGGGGGGPQMDGGGSDQQEASTPEYSKIASTTTMKPSSTSSMSPTKYRKPVRSVQIIGEE